LSSKKNYHGKYLTYNLILYITHNFVGLLAHLAEAELMGWCCVRPSVNFFL